ncbi:MAG: AraC family transcriptional regulator [Citrobacter freundii]|nr:MAG: AraC family transcriptional regulator [Citrobacter freundii]
MLLNEIKPGAFLAEYVRLYRIIDFHFGDDIVIPPKLYTPRPEHCLQFYPLDTETVNYPTQQKSISNIRSTLVGQHTVLQHRQVGKRFLSIQVVFQPTALFRLTGMDLCELENTYADAKDIFGTQTDIVNEQLFEAKSYAGMISVVEQFLKTLVKQSGKHKMPIDLATNFMLYEEERFNVDTFLQHSYLSHRQFDRLFKERVGVSPKLFLQIIRFDKAFRMKNRFPDRDWLTIALHCGYHDYQHLVKDYKAFTGYTPKQFFVLDNNAPERSFGDAEI